MITEGYRFRFRDGIGLEEVHRTLLLSLLAASGIHAGIRLRMDARYAIDLVLNVVVIDVSTEVGQDVAGIFTAFITAAFGPLAFSVRPLGEGVAA
jgi:hypothetical protein